MTTTLQKVKTQMKVENEKRNPRRLLGTQIVTSARYALAFLFSADMVMSAALWYLDRSVNQIKLAIAEKENETKTNRTHC